MKQSPHAQLLKLQTKSARQRRLQKDKENNGQLIYFCVRDGRYEIFGKIIKNYPILYKQYSSSKNLKNNYDIHILYIWAPLSLQTLYIPATAHINKIYFFLNLYIHNA